MPIQFRVISRTWTFKKGDRNVAGKTPLHAYNLSAYQFDLPADFGDMIVTRILTVLFVVMFVAATTAFADDTPPFKITTRRDTDRVEVKVEKDTTIFSVHSPLGISNAVIERTHDKWPDAVVLRLHLRGLEFFQTTNGHVTLKAAASIQNANVRVWQDGKEGHPLDSKGRYWIAIQMFDGDGKPTDTVLLKDGYFEMQLPRAFFEDNPKSITFDWIDFLR